MKEFLDIESYNYDLPESNIAQFAIEPRDDSKLLIYNQGEISKSKFNCLSDFIESNSVLIYNNAKVIPARVYLKNKNNANIEVFLLQPFGMDHATALNAKDFSVWKCLIGNSKKWKSDELLFLELNGEIIELQRKEDQVVEFKLTGQTRFSEILELIGYLPLPPYIKHEANELDASRYQTVYAKTSGSVAAPTAGLHFTDSVFRSLEKRGISRQEVTLHVSAGTFLPVKVQNALEHEMHSEVFEIDETLLETIKSNKRIIAVGTTSCRVLESMYWLALEIKNGAQRVTPIEQFPYLNETMVMSRDEVSFIIKEFMKKNDIQNLIGMTSIMIAPGYEFKMVDELITNFHQPKSTLLMLISAFVGEDWKRVYEYAKQESFRFLSYGDSSILRPKRIF